MTLLLKIFILLIPAFGFAQNNWTTFENTEKIQGSKYVLHTQVKTQHSKPSIKRIVRRTSLWRRIFTSRKPFIFLTYKANQADTLALSISHKKSSDQPVRFSGTLRILYNPGGLSSPRALNIVIENSAIIKLDFHTIKKLIEDELGYEWRGYGWGVMVYGITLSNTDKDGETPSLELPSLRFNFYDE